jgi:hypothetical protein
MFPELRFQDATDSQDDRKELSHEPEDQDGHEIKQGNTAVMGEHDRECSIHAERSGSGTPGQWCSIADPGAIPALPGAGLLDEKAVISAHSLRVVEPWLDMNATQPPLRARMPPEGCTANKATETNQRARQKTP